MKKNSIGTLTGVSLLALFTLLFLISFASALSSPSFRIPAYSINGGGTISTSEHFRLFSSIGQSTPIGPSLSAGFKNNAGLIPQLVRLPPCLFKADITATGQDLPGANRSGTVFIGIAAIPLTLPAPGYKPNYTADIRIQDDLLEDIRQSGSASEQWDIILETGPYADPTQAGYYPIISWDTNQFCDQDKNPGLMLYLSDTQQGTLIPLADMYSTSSYQVKENEMQCISGRCSARYAIVWSQDYTQDYTLEMALPGGWSMISLPVLPKDATVYGLFPEALVVYGFQKDFGYSRKVAADPLQPGEGYWILLPRAKTYTLTGECIQGYTRSVENGWIMAGGCSYPARASLDKGSIQVIYRFEPGSGYQRILQTQAIGPGMGYWILISGSTGQSELKVEPK